MQRTPERRRIPLLLRIDEGWAHVSAFDLRARRAVARKDEGGGVPHARFLSAAFSLCDPHHRPGRYLTFFLM